MQIKIRYHFTILRLAKNKYSENIKSRWRCMKGGNLKNTLLDEVYMGTTTSLKTVRHYPISFACILWHSNSTCGYIPQRISSICALREVYRNIHNILKITQMSVDCKMDKKAVVYAYNRTFCSSEMNKLQLKASTWIISKLMLKKQSTKSMISFVWSWKTKNN